MKQDHRLHGFHGIGKVVREIRASCGFGFSRFDDSPKRHGEGPLIENRKSKIHNLLLSFLLLVAPAFAQTTAVVHLRNGQTEPLIPEATQFETADKSFIRGPARGRSVEFRASQLWQIEFGHESVARGSAEQLWLSDGTRLSGQLLKWNSPERPIVQSDLFRSLAIWDESILGLTHGWPPPSRLPAAPAQKDVLFTTDGDQLVGRFLQIDRASIGFRSELGTLSCPRHRMNALALAPRSTAQTEPGPWVLLFANGDRVWTKSWVIEGGRIRCALSGSNPTAPASLLERALCLDARVEIFSRIQPRQFSMKPVLAGTRAVLVDRAPDDKPLRAGGREYLFGLFLRPECELDYALSEGSEFFLAQAGLTPELCAADSPRAAARRRARISFAVGEGPEKTFDLAGDKPPVAVTLPLAGARRLRIRVAAADDWAAGAHVVLGEPVVMKK